MRRVLIPILFCFAAAGLQAQNGTWIGRDTLSRVVVNGDTLRHVNLPQVIIRAKKGRQTRWDDRQYWRLVYNLKVVLPYAKIVVRTVNQVEAKIAGFQSDKEKRKYMKAMEDSLWKLYEPDLRKMTITQGKLLFKLIDRETTQSTYYWIDSFRGSVSATFWQGMARLFGTNLKSKYDPQGEDMLIEQIVSFIEKGYI